MKSNEYYNGTRIVGSKAWLCFSMGNRSIGKSFYYKRFCIKRFLEKGEKFLYIRRRDVDLKDAMPVWFDDISFKFPNYSLDTKKNTIVISKVEDNPETGEKEIKSSNVCGYYTYLSALSRLKSMPMEDVTTILFDEFLPDDGRYLKTADPFYEPQLLMSLYMTVARGIGKPIRTNVKIICIANTTSLFNPYFTYFGIDMTGKQNYLKDGMLVEITYNQKAADEIKATDFGRVLQRTRYGGYALENQSLLDIKSQIHAIPEKARPYCLVYFNKWYGAFVDDSGVYWKNTYDETFPHKYKLIDDEMCDGIPWFKGSIVKIFKTMNERGQVFYSTLEDKAVLAGLFQ